MSGIFGTAPVIIVSYFLVLLTFYSCHFNWATLDITVPVCSMYFYPVFRRYDESTVEVMNKYHYLYNECKLLRCWNERLMVL